MPRYAVDERHRESWGNTFDRNVALAKKAGDPDVVLLGDSITEHWLGTGLGIEKYPDINEVYKDLFQNKKIQGIEGVALGISGDRVSTSCASSTRS